MTNLRSYRVWANLGRKGYTELGSVRATTDKIASEKAKEKFGFAVVYHIRHYGDGSRSIQLMGKL